MDPALAWSDILVAQTPGYKRRVHEMMAWIARNDRSYHAGKTPLAVYRTWSTRVEKQAGVPPSLSAPPAQIGDVPPGLKARSANCTSAAPTSPPIPEPGSRTIWRPSTAEGPGPVATARGDTVGRTRPQHVVDGRAAPRHETRHHGVHARVLQELTASTSMQQLMLCNENRSVADPTQWPASYVQNFIVGGAFEAPGLLYKSGMACAGAAPVGKAVPVRNRGLKVQPLQFQSTGDPQTHCRQSLAMRRLMGTHLITVGGGDHGQVGRRSKVINNAVVTYLRTGAPP